MNMYIHMSNLKRRAWPWGLMSKLLPHGGGPEAFLRFWQMF